MFVTFVSLIMAVALVVGMDLVPGVESMMVISKDYFELYFGVCFSLSLLPWMCMLFLSQGAETQPITIAALRSNLDDRKLYVYAVSIVVVSLIGMIIVLQPLYPESWSFVGSVVCAGILVDLFRMSYCRVQFRRTPEGLVEWFIEVMRKSVKNGDEKWHTISLEIPFGLMVFYMKSGAYGSLRLFCHGIVEISDLWLGSIARLIMFQLPGQYEESLLDRYSQAEVSTAKRFSWIIQEACALGSLTAVEEATRLAGKLFITFHNHHESLGYMLLGTLSQASQKDCGRVSRRDLDMEVVSAFSEVIKSLIEQSVRRNAPETTAILNVLAILENTLKEISRRDKTIPNALLLHPLARISQMLEYHRYRSFPGREEVEADLRRIVAHFLVLEGVSGRLVEGAGAMDSETSFNEGSPFKPKIH